MVLISLDIEDKIKRDCKQKGLRFSTIFMKGYEQIVNGNIQEATIDEMRKKLERVSNLLNHYVARAIKAEDDLIEYQKQLEAVKDVLGKKQKKLK